MDPTSFLRAYGLDLARPLDPAFLADVRHGLGNRPKTLPAKYFYDLEGSRLFEEITRLPEYYPTRTELAILREQGSAIGELLASGAVVVEFGAGSSEKIRVLLRGLREPRAYVPIDVSAQYLADEAARLRADLPDLEVYPVAGDFTRPIRLRAEVGSMPIVGFFPGSTIGNFEPDVAASLLADFAQRLRTGASLVIGVDLVKDKAVLDRAYDDAAGATARFNLNVLRRINRELGADFDLDAFAHRAFFDPVKSRIEMHIVSRRAQVVRVAGRPVDFEAGETIHTENSYKYTPERFRDLATSAGWEPLGSFIDPDRLFAVFVLRAL